jgi:integrase/recombinase XerD
MHEAAATLIPAQKRESLVAWCNLYLGIEGRAGSDNTSLAKKRDLEAFLGFLLGSAGRDHPDQWTRSVTRDFLKHLERKLRRSPSTINRMLATLRHAAAWIHSQRPFLAGPPCDRIQDLELEEPEWKGLEDIEITRLKSAAEQLIHVDTKRNQQPVRNYALFMVLHHTGLRISELLALELSQYQGKHFTNVKRKGKAVSRKVFLSKDAREALDRYIAVERGKKAGAVFCSKSGGRLERQAVDEALKAIAVHANASLPEDQQIHLSAHLLRHTFLRKVARKYGVEYAKELAGHTSERYIWRYVQPSEEEKERAVEDLF